MDPSSSADGHHSRLMVVRKVPAWAAILLTREGPPPMTEWFIWHHYFVLTHPQLLEVQ